MNHYEMIKAYGIETLDVRRAYGKQRTKDEAVKDWKNGMDFGDLCGQAPYLSIRDSERLKEAGIKSVMIWTGDREGIEVPL